MIWFFVSALAWGGAILAPKYYWRPFLLILFLLSGFRYYVGSDYDDYVFLYEHAAQGRDVPVEASFSLMALLLSNFEFNFQAQILFYTICTFLFAYKGLLKVSRDRYFIGISVLFFYMVFYFPSLSIMRQALAASISFYACYAYLKNKDFIKFSLLVLLSSFFHLSGIIYFILIPLASYKPAKIAYIVIMVFLLFFGYFLFADFISIFATVTGFSYKGYAFGPMPISSPIFYIFTVILVLVFCYALCIANRDDYFILNVVMVIIAFRFLAVDYKPINRLGASFSIFLPIFIYQVIFSKFNRRSRLLALTFALLLMLTSDYFRSVKDYSYYQYAFNICAYKDPCPVSIIGDLPLEMLRIREEVR